MAKRKQKKKSNMSGYSRIGLFGVIGIVILTMPFLWGTWFIILAMGIPTFVAWMLDRTSARYLLQCILAVNAVGLMPALSELWLSKAFWEASVIIEILSNVYYYLFSYSISLIGWALFVYVPRFIARHIARRAQRRVDRLRARQESLIVEWGDKVRIAALGPNAHANINMRSEEEELPNDFDGDLEDEDEMIEELIEEERLN